MCKIHVRKIFQGDDFNRVVSVDGKLPVSDIQVIAAFTILTKIQIDKLVALGCEFFYEDLQDIPVK